MYCIKIGSEEFYETEEDIDEFDGILMKKAKLDQWMNQKKQKARFVYDFGDDWVTYRTVTYKHTLGLAKKDHLDVHQISSFKPARIISSTPRPSPPFSCTDFTALSASTCL